jgi:hypothetical protein
VAEIEYEPRDVNVRTVLKAGIVLAGITLFGVLASLAVFALFGRQGARSDVAPPPLAYEPGRLPPEPRLQSAPLRDIDELRAQETQRLSAYGWVDEPAGVVRIPIEEAMRLYAERAAGRSLTPVAAPAVLPAPSAAAGASGTATVPPAARPPSPEARRPPR